MGRHVDKDVKGMSVAELRQEVMKLRTAFRHELASTGNRRCWVNLLNPLPEGRSIEPLSIPRPVFLSNCAWYYDRNRKPLPREVKRLLAKGRKLGDEVARQLGIPRE